MQYSLTGNADIDKYKYSGYGMGLDRHGLRFYSHPGGVTGGNLIIFEVDMSSCTKIDKRKKTRLNRYVWDFGVDYDFIAVDDMLDINKYLMQKRM